jgi:hypothetical protein
LTAFSPLADPELSARAASTELCLRDLAVFSGIRPTLPTYSATLLPPVAGAVARSIAVRTRGQADVCVELPRLSERDHRAGSLSIELVSSTPGDGHLVASLHDAGNGSYTLVGLTRVPVAD